MTDGGAATFVPIVALCDVALFATMLFAGPAVPLALNTTVLMPEPVAVRVLLFVPAVWPSVHDVSAASPDAFVATVATLAGLIAPPVPPVAVNWNVTLNPATGLLNWSRTFTEGGVATFVPTVALCA